MVNTQTQGFTLIEIMIVVVIIGILAAITYPSYQKYVVKTKRVDMMTEMEQIGSRIEANKITYKRYDRIPLNEIYSNPTASTTTTFPNTGDALYNVSVTPISGTTLGSREWTVTATPITGGQMAADKNLTLNHLGIRCRDPDGSAKCGSNGEWNK